MLAAAFLLSNAFHIAILKKGVCCQLAVPVSESKVSMAHDFVIEADEVVRIFLAMYRCLVDGTVLVRAGVFACDTISIDALSELLMLGCISHLAAKGKIV